jgi:hypothetical protein
MLFCVCESAAGAELPLEAFVCCARTEGISATKTIRITTLNNVFTKDLTV